MRIWLGHFWNWRPFEAFYNQSAIYWISREIFHFNWHSCQYNAKQMRNTKRFNVFQNIMSPIKVSIANSLNIIFIYLSMLLMFRPESYKLTTYPASYWNIPEEFPNEMKNGRTFRRRQRHLLADNLETPTQIAFLGRKLNFLAPSCLQLSISIGGFFQLKKLSRSAASFIGQVNRRGRPDNGAIFSLFPSHLFGREG